MQSFFDENDVKFDVGSSPIPFSDNVRQPEFDFSFGLHSPSPSRISSISNIDTDLFPEFPTFDPNFFISDNLKPNDPSSVLADRQLAQQFFSQPIKFSTNPDSRLVTYTETSDPSSSEVYDKSQTNPKVTEVYSASQPTEVPKTRKKRNSTLTRKSHGQATNQPNPDLTSHSQEVMLVNSTSAVSPEKILRKKKQKLRKNMETFQPFVSFTNLETTVKSLRELMNSPHNIHHNVLTHELSLQNPDN